MSLGILSGTVGTQRTHLERAACTSSTWRRRNVQRVVIETAPGQRWGRVGVPMHFDHYILSSQADYDTTTIKHSLKLSVLNICDVKCNLKDFLFFCKDTKSFFLSLPWTNAILLSIVPS